MYLWLQCLNRKCQYIIYLIKTCNVEVVYEIKQAEGSVLILCRWYFPNIWLTMSCNAFSPWVKAAILGEKFIISCQSCIADDCLFDDWWGDQEETGDVEEAKIQRAKREAKAERSLHWRSTCIAFFPKSSEATRNNDYSEQHWMTSHISNKNLTVRGTLLWANAYNMLPIGQFGRFQRCTATLGSSLALVAHGWFSLA